ncbi:hypothetical protein ACFO25_19750 [Paenactinomyces guangxiensis]|uniref:Uncharacterized protein n=1 Tax=Paenactinomyces guangxiensis TaxID=1490290 RepID=A0A7W2AAI9_9BACL|nr:hypothetical protein [Paenactinomyces guangxiensis]MBA4496249.1 hypothetical protein [Paenactinomyces guangxiensis]MBH8593369.1 hypothetical protein [Paenactinomyces guangxiensis]
MLYLWCCKVVEAIRSLYRHEWLYGCKEEQDMKSQVQHGTNENQENDFLDAVVSTAVTTAVFMGIFIVATVISLLK